MKSKDSIISKILYWFLVLGLPKYIARPLTLHIKGWVQNNGPEWTVTRLKNIKIRFSLHLAGYSSLPGDWDGIASRDGSIIPKGPFGALFHSRYTEKHKGRKLIYSILDCYNVFVSDEVTRKQWYKFFDSAQQAENVSENENTCTGSLNTRPLLGHISLEDVVHQLNHVVPQRIRIPERPRVRSVVEYPVSPESFAPNSDGKSVSETHILDTMSCLWESELCKTLFLKYPSMNRALGPLLDIVVEQYLSKDKVQHDKPSKPTPASRVGTRDFVGKVSFIQEPGFKLRAVANPFRIFQLALSSLAVQLYRTLRTLPWDCTFDQDKPDEEIHKALSNGTVISCFDLSDATNNIPLDDQLYLLRRLGCDPSDVSLFREVSTSPWLVKNPITNKWELMKWTRGQPLGLISSFASFALWHGALLRAIELCLKLNKTFFVLGDDVIILNTDVAQIYESVLQHFDIPISIAKSTKSNKLASFAGKVFYEGKTYRTLRWKSPSNRSFVEVAKQLGPKAFKLFTLRQRKVLELIAEYPEPYGLGFNPKGKPLGERYSNIPPKLMDESPTFLTKEASIDSLRRLTRRSVTFSMKSIMDSALVREWFIQASKDRPDPLNCVEPRDRIISSLGIRRDVFNPEDKTDFQWETIVKTSSHPFDTSTLELLEKKLSILLQSD